MPFTSGHGEAGSRRGSAARLIAAVRAVGGVALLCAAAGCAPPTDRYDPPLPAATAVPERSNTPRPAGSAAARTGMGGPAGAGALGGMGEAVEGHRERLY